MKRKRLLLLSVLFFCFLSGQIYAQQLLPDDLSEIPIEQLLTTLNIIQISQLSNSTQLMSLFDIYKTTIGELSLRLKKSETTIVQLEVSSIITQEKLTKAEESVKKSTEAQQKAQESLKKFKDVELPEIKKKARNDGLRDGMLIGGGVVLAIGTVIYVVSRIIPD